MIRTRSARNGGRRANRGNLDASSLIARIRHRHAIALSITLPLDGIGVINLSPQFLMGSLSVAGLQDERSAPTQDPLLFPAPTLLRRMVVLARCSPARGLFPSWSKRLDPSRPVRQTFHNRIRMEMRPTGRLATGSHPGLDDEVHRRLGRAPEVTETGLLEDLAKLRLAGLGAEGEAHLLRQRIGRADT